MSRMSKPTPSHRIFMGHPVNRDGWLHIFARGLSQDDVVVGGYIFLVLHLFIRGNAGRTIVFAEQEKT